MKHLYPVFLCLVFLSFFALPGLFAQSDDENFTPADWDITFDKCEGKLEIDFNIVEREGDDTWWYYMEVHIKTPNASSSEIAYKLRHEDHQDHPELPNQVTDPAIMHFVYTYQITNVFGSKVVATYSFNNNTETIRGKLVLTELTEEFLGGALEVKIEGLWRGDNGNQSEIAQTKSAPAIDLSAPSSVLATNDLCNKVEITVSGSLDCEAISGGTNTIELYRRSGQDDFVLHDTYTIPANTEDYEHIFTHNNLQSSANYSYRARLKYENSSSSTTYLSRNIPPSGVPGSSEALPLTPNNFKATDNDCEEVVKLTWSWGGLNPENGFVIERSLDSMFTNPVMFTAVADQRSYDDETVAPKTTYYYRIFARNQCNATSAPSSFDAGQSPGKPTAADNVVATIDSTRTKILISWNDNSSDETGFVIERSLQGGAGVATFQVDKNITSFEDDQIVSCQTYVYKVKAKNDCGEQDSNNQASIRLEPDLSNTFGDNSFEVAKGYFNNRVELSWTPEANDNLIGFYKIFRRPLGSQDTFVQIQVVTGQTNIFNDLIADAGVLYEYKIRGESECENETLVSNEASGNGFRSASGVVNGQITYEGNFAVEGVKVIAKRAGSASVGRSLGLDGVDDYAEIPNDTLLNPGAMTLETWVRPDPAITGDGTIIDKMTSTGGYRLEFLHSSQKARFSVYDNSGDLQTLEADSSLLSPGQYTQISVRVSNDSILLFINGEAENAMAFTGPIHQDSVPLNFGMKRGSADFFKGEIDETRIWSIARDVDLIERDYNRILNPDEPGLVATWSFDEGLGTGIYDRSKTGNQHNKQHGEIHGATWSITIPDEDRLSLYGITDSTGVYQISNIRYAGAGEIFSLTPSLGALHKFEPQIRSISIGDGSNLLNNQNFKDITSFKVTGTVTFTADEDCPSRDVFLKIDGQIVTRNGEPVTTNALGEFEIQVPIGEHRVSLEKAGHGFSVGRWPTNGGLHNFQDEVPGIEFKDSTEIIVIGRMVGGIREGNKKPGLGKSTNNLGRGEIIFTATAGGGCLVDTVLTDSATGEYRTVLPPLNYNVTEARILHPNHNINREDFDMGGQQLMLSENLPIQLVRDTNVLADTTIYDSVAFHKIRNFIYRTPAQLEVFMADRTTPFSGDSVVTYTNPQGHETQLQVDTLLPYPVFQRGKPYKALITAFERYQNFDSGTPVRDDVPVTDGELIIDNGLVPISGLTLPLTNGDTLYQFIAGEPQIAENATTPAYSFTKTFGITLERPGQSDDATWQPNPGNTPEEQIFRAYVLGGKASGNSNFTAQGPRVVDFVIRDPPGSNSSAFLRQDSTFTQVSSASVRDSETGIFNRKIRLGTKFSIGFGYQTSTEIFNDIHSGSSVVRSATNDTETTETWSFSSTQVTNSAPEAVGARSDLYIGKTQNVIFGITNNIEILPDSLCGPVPCAPGTSSFRIGRRNGLFMTPSANQAHFVFDQTHIENVIIPNLVALRNDMFIKHPLEYHSNIPFDDPRYGTNNDDKVWADSVSTNTPFKTEDADKSGSSYIWNVPGMEYNVNHDTIRWMNQQIRLWENAIRENEKDKHKSMQDPNNKVKTHDFNAGTQLNEEATTTKSTSNSETVEYGFSANAAFVISTNVSGSGLENSLGLEVEYNKSTTSGSTTTTSTTWGYNLFDENQGDVFTVDVYNSESGWGPIFRTEAGQSSCPYEGEITAQYYEENGVHPVLSVGTFQRENPEIDIVPNRIQNVPSDEEAVFTLTLTSANEWGVGESAFTFGLKLLDASNPHGAQVSIDGGSPNFLQVTIPSQSSITKTLVVRRGPVEYDYEDLQLVIHSLCQYSAGTSFEEDIVDTVTFSVNFIPTCTRVNVDRPLDLWVLNTFNQDTLDVVLDDYNVNFPDLNYINLEYKPAAESQWNILQSFWHPNLQDSTNYSAYLSDSTTFTRYAWDMSQIVDGDYHIRAVSVCDLATNESEILSGHADRVNPRPFGSPSPADGILDPNDDIMIQFNEVIDEGSLTPANFDIRGVLNGTDLRHQESVSFNGVNNFAQIPQGYHLNLRSFAVEFWAKRNGTGEACLFSQGVSGLQSIYIGFDANDKFTMTVAGQTITTDESYMDQDWHHFVVSYDHNEQEAKIFVDVALKKFADPFFAGYRATGPILIGKSSAEADRYFNGLLHELRLWDVPRDLADVALYVNHTLSGREAGLIGNWPMDEAIGDIAFDKVRNRHAALTADWSILPVGRAFQFDGSSDYLQASTGTMVFTDETDFTIEFWFKGNTGTNQTIFSNGRGDGTDTNTTGWSIGTDVNGAYVVRNKGQTFQATNASYWDDNWHHFALVVRRLSTIACYIDGELKNTETGDIWSGLGASNLWLGCRGWYQSGQIILDQFFNGELDEVRIWNTARRQEQIARDRVNRMIGDEFGLRAYYPFEHYEEDAGVFVLSETLNNESVDTLHLTAGGSTTYIQQTPPIKLQRPIRKVNFTYTVNQDKIVLTPTDPSGRIENVTLDVTVKRIKDLYGNYMQSPATWIAYVDKNQVVWEDQQLEFEKLYNEPLSFSANILNTGGSLEEFNINNLPSWLTATPSSGAIEPNSQKTIQFEVNPGVNSGTYEQDLYLRTDFGYNEKLLLNLKVYHQPPDWSIDPTQFEYTMNIIGAIRIDGVISTDDEDQIAAFVNCELRGSGRLQYVPSLDRYLVFLDVYSNISSGEKLEFQVWNADEGQIHTDVMPTINFATDASIGSLISPQIFEARSTFLQSYQFRDGWNWISFPLESDTLGNLNQLFDGLAVENGDVFSSQTNFDQYQSGTGWAGSLSAAGGIKISEGYRLRISNEDVFKYVGRKVDPDTVKTVIEAGWNWIGLISQGNLEINDALATLNPTNGDLIKSQYAFAVYDDNLGWLGSLEYMEPTRGYMIKSATKDTLVYPRSGIFGLSGLEEENKSLQDSLVYALLDFYPEAYPETMSIIAEVENCFPDEKEEQLYLIAYYEDEARGIAPMQYLPASESWKAYLTTFGIQAEGLTFKVFDLENQQLLDLDEAIAFVPNQLEGTLEEATFFHFIDGCDAVVTEVMQHSLEKVNQVLISPNPSSSTVYLTINMENNDNVQVSIRDLNGRIIAVPKTRQQTYQQLLLEWDGRGANGKIVSAGMYFVEVVSGDYRFSEKLIRL